MNKWRKMEVEGRAIIQHYRKQVEYAARKGYLEMYRGCKDKLWGACAMGVTMGLLTREEQSELDAWAENIWLDEQVRRCSNDITKGEERQCCPITEIVISEPEKIPG